MEIIKTISLMMGASWASGINLYATVLVLGLSHRFEWVTLPQTLDPLASWPVIGVAAVLYLMEFLADKIPAVDSVWDSVHTFIRPLGGAALAFLAIGQATPQFQLIAVMIGGALALEAHALKATTRLAINTSPEPVTNVVASIAEDVGVVSLLALAMAYPLAAAICLTGLVIGSAWLLIKLVKILRAAFRRLFGGSKHRRMHRPPRPEDALHPVDV